MKFGWAVLLVLAMPFVAGRAHAQGAVYGEFSVQQLTNLVATDHPIGATAGVLVDGPKLYGKILLQGNAQGRFVRDSHESLNGVVIGPRLGLSPKAFGLAPYGEFLIGFARLHSDGVNTHLPGNTTDAMMEFNGGVTKKMSPHWDGTADFSYAQYYALGGQYNPKTFSVGAVYHFEKR